MTISTLNFGDCEIALFLLVAKCWPALDVEFEPEYRGLGAFWTIFRHPSPSASFMSWYSEWHTSAYSSLLFKPCWAIQLSFRKQEGKGGLRYFTKQFWLTLSHQAVSSGHIFNNFLYWDHHANIIVLPKVSKSLPSTTLVSITVIIQFPPVLFLYFFPSFWFRVFIVTVYDST